MICDPQTITARAGGSRTSTRPSCFLPVGCVLGRSSTLPRTNSGWYHGISWEKGLPSCWWLSVPPTFLGWGWHQAFGPLPFLHSRSVSRSPFLSLQLVNCFFHMSAYMSRCVASGVKDHALYRGVSIVGLLFRCTSHRYQCVPRCVSWHRCFLCSASPSFWLGVRTFLLSRCMCAGCGLHPLMVSHSVSMDRLPLEFSCPPISFGRSRRSCGLNS
jgi:hypothetical protein